jgi:uncharacterized protein YecT (DUF1311 family)
MSNIIKLSGLLAATLLAISPAPALAQKVSHTEVAADLRLCIENAPLPDDVPTCRGRPTRACESKAPGEPPVALSVRCMEAEAEAWDDYLDMAVSNRNAKLRQLDVDVPYARPEMSRVDRLEAAQKAWRAFLMAECSQVASEFIPAQTADYSYAACLMNMTADRAIDLMMMEEF